MNAASQMPYLGVGIEWDMRLNAAFLEHLDRFDCIEFIPENFFYADRLQMTDILDAIRDTGVPSLGHGVELSIGSFDPLKTDHLSNMLDVMSLVPMVAYSEHLSLIGEKNIEIGQLTPLPWCQKLADHIANKIRQVKSMLGVPFLIENITNRFVYPTTEMSETAFINSILQSAECGLLLDVTNVYTNSVNFGFDPYEWMEKIDPAYVAQIHLAGGEYDKDGVLQDSHDNAVFEPVWHLFDFAIERFGPVTTIIERTGNIPEMSQLLEEVDRAKGIIESAKIPARSRAIHGGLSYVG